MNNPSNSPTHDPFTDDEKRLVRFFRCLDSHGRSELLREAGQRAMSEHLPDRSVMEFMPEAGGVMPERIDGNLQDMLSTEGTITEILYAGIQATGEPHETLLGTSEDPEREEEAIERFAAAASEQASKQGSAFKYDETFARHYLRAWRWEIVKACEAVAKRVD